MNRLLSRPALALSRVSVRRGGGHVMNDETISHWKKVSLDTIFILWLINYDSNIILDFFLFLSSFPHHRIHQQRCQNPRTYDPSSMEPSKYWLINYDSWIIMTHRLILGPMVQHDHRQAPMVWWLSRRFLLDSLQLRPKQGLRRWPQRRCWNRPRRSLITIIKILFILHPKLSFLTFCWCSHKSCFKF